MLVLTDVLTRSPSGAGSSGEPTGAPGAAAASSELPRALRQEVLRVHRNLGHPPLPELLRVFKVAGVRDDVLQCGDAATYSVPLDQFAQLQVGLATALRMILIPGLTVRRACRGILAALMWQG